MKGLPMRVKTVLTNLFEDKAGRGFSSSAQAMEEITPSRVASLTEAEILWQRNCGEKMLQVIKDWLAGYGLTLRVDPLWSADPVAANVYADWLGENGEPAAAAKLRAAFPLDDGRREAP